jgi:hypothetical protein
VSIYDSEDTPYTGRHWDDIYAAIVSWVGGLDEAKKGLGHPRGPSSPDLEPALE